MHRNYTPAVAATLAKETIISTLVNALLPAVIIWLISISPPRTLLGPDSILPSLVFGSGIATVAMTLVLTTIIRKRVAAGSLPAFDWPRAERGWYRWIPGNLLLRAVVLAAVAIMLLVPAGFLVVALTGILPLSDVGALVFNIGFGACTGLLMTRFVILPALADGLN